MLRELGVFALGPDGVDVPALRRRLDGFSPPTALGVDAREIDVIRPHVLDEREAFLVAEWVVPPVVRSARRVVLLHGGGFVAGSRRSHRGLAARIARAAGAPVLLPEYRLAPEHPHPAALEDALLAIEVALRSGPEVGGVVDVDELPSAHAEVALVGDSAGGGLGLASLLARRDRGLSMVEALVLLSPWLDLAKPDAERLAFADLDPVVPARALSRWAALYAPGTLADPYVSPVRGSLEGLPRTLVHVGDPEVLLDDALVFVERARAAGVSVELERFPGYPHVFHAYAGALPEARRAIEELGRFIAR